MGFVDPSLALFFITTLLAYLLVWYSFEKMTRSAIVIARLNIGRNKSGANPTIVGSYSVIL